MSSARSVADPNRKTVAISQPPLTLSERFRLLYEQPSLLIPNPPPVSKPPQQQPKSKGSTTTSSQKSKGPSTTSKPSSSNGNKPMTKRLGPKPGPIENRLAPRLEDRLAPASKGSSGGKNGKQVIIKSNSGGGGVTKKVIAKGKAKSASKLDKELDTYMSSV